MNAQTSEQKEKKVAKRKIAKKKGDGLQEFVNHKPEAKPKKEKKSKEPKTPAQWLETYTKNELSTSGAVQVTRLLMKGASLEECVQLATSIGSLKNSKWGQSKSSIKSHLKFLASKKCQIQDLGNENFKVSA